MTDVLEVLLLRKYPGLWSETDLMMNFSFAFISFVTFTTPEPQTSYV